MRSILSRCPASSRTTSLCIHYLFTESQQHPQHRMTLAVSSHSPPGPGTLLHYGYCEMNVWVEFWVGVDPPFFPAAPTFACPLELPKLFTALMVVVGLESPPPLPSLVRRPSLLPPFPPRFWIRTPST